MESGKMREQPMNREHIIWRVQPESIAEEMEIEPGDVLLAINDKEIQDIFDYHFLINDEYIVVLIRKKDGEEWELEIEKMTIPGFLFSRGIILL